jgi:hypothetical protein
LENIKEETLENITETDLVPDQKNSTETVDSAACTVSASKSVKLSDLAKTRPSLYSGNWTVIGTH